MDTLLALLRSLGASGAAANAWAAIEAGRGDDDTVGELVARLASHPEASPAARPEASPAARPEASPAARPEASPAARPEVSPAAASRTRTSCEPAA